MNSKAFTGPTPFGVISTNLISAARFRNAVNSASVSHRAAN